MFSGRELCDLREAVQNITYRAVCTYPEAEGVSPSLLQESPTHGNYKWKHKKLPFPPALHAASAVRNDTVTLSFPGNALSFCWPLVAINVQLSISVSVIKKKNVMLIAFIRATLLIKLYRFQVDSSITPSIYCTVCASLQARSPPPPFCHTAHCKDLIYLFFLLSVAGSSVSNCKGQ